MSEIKDVIVQGLWKNNSALVQLLGLCPLLAVTSTATNALGLGLATTFVLTLTNLAVSMLRRWTPPEIRIPIYVMIIASVVSAVQMLINAYAFGLYQSLGIFIPLIVTNCIVVGRAEAFAAKKGPALSALDGFLYRHGGPPAPCSYSAPCARCWVTARCLTARMACWATGRRCYALRCSIPIHLSCWRCCLQARLLAWA
ncbi:electron transport complex protein [Pseudescherichia vulneris]|nr:electron transport complex protein [Pseudescherichia vulneris]